MDKENLLKKISLFSGLSREGLSRVADIARLKKVERGKQIFSEESIGNSLFVVVEGRVKIFSNSPSGKIKTFAYLEPKDVFGEMSLLDQSPRSASAQAVEDTTLVVIHRREFKQFLTDHPLLSYSLLRTVCARLRRADREIKLMSFSNVLGRLARILLDLAMRYGRPAGPGVRIDLELSHQELADLVGTAREMVTRILNRFRRTGCISFEKKSITIRDSDKLKSWIY